MSITIKDKSEFDQRFKFTYDPQVMNHKLSTISELETQIKFTFVPYVGEIPCFQHFVWVRPPVDSDCDQPRKSQKIIRKIGKSWHSEIRPIFRSLPFYL